MKRIKDVLTRLCRRVRVWRLRHYEQFYIEESFESLDSLRHSWLPSLFDAERIREYSSEAGFTLRHLGTSEKELQKLLGNAVVKWLDILRDRTPYTKGEHRGSSSLADMVVKYIRGYASQTGCTLAELGINEEEIVQYLRRFHRRDAEQSLKLARESFTAPNIRQYAARDVRRHVAGAGCTLEDLGTNEQEIAGFLRERELPEYLRGIFL